MTWEQWVSIIALVLALVAVVVGVMVLRRLRARGVRTAPYEQVESREDSSGTGPPAFVVNPVKLAHPERFRAMALAIAQELGLPEPLWLTTTVDDPGLGQAQHALDQGASVVVAAGGDGTVRAVATALSGTGVPMGLVPMGTGNLLARNLELPLEDDRAKIHTALTGANRPIDVGWIRPRDLLPLGEESAGDDVRPAGSADQPYGGSTEGRDSTDGTRSLNSAAAIASPTDSTADDKTGTTPDNGPARSFGSAGSTGGVAAGTADDTADDDVAAGSAQKEPPDALARQPEQPFLVMGGIGFDAAMVAGADADMKARMGWFAYFVAGVRNLHGRKIRVQMQIGDAPARQLRLRTLLFANCGRLPGGMVLFPDAEYDDGWLDIAAIDTRRSVLGWADLFGKVVLQGVGFRRALRGSPSTITFWRGRDIHVRLEQPEQIQVDGDLLGTAEALSVRVDHRALIMRVAG